MRTFRRAHFALLVVVLALLTAVSSFADDLTEFELGRNSYAVGKYDEAAQRFGEMLDPDNENRLKTPELVERARIYRAASLIALGRIEEADAEIETTLRANPSAYPDPVIFPGPVLDRFTVVRGHIRQELEDKAREKARQERLRLEKEQARLERERARVAKLEELAKQEQRVVSNSRWIATVPFGVGQFQNDQDALGWTLLATESALAVTSIVTAAMHQDLEPLGNDSTVDKADLNDQLGTLETVNRISFTAFALVAAGGIVHAHLTFVPERKEVRTRELPSELRAAPAVGVVPGGAMVGLGGTF